MAFLNSGHAKCMALVQLSSSNMRRSKCNMLSYIEVRDVIHIAEFNAGTRCKISDESVVQIRLKAVAHA